MTNLIDYTYATEEISFEVKSFLNEWFDSSDFIVVKTSGSTGAPQEIRLEKAKMIVSARKTIEFLNLEKNQTAFLCLSPKTIAGKMMIVRSIVGNLKLYVGQVNNNPLENVSERIDFIALVPLQLQAMLPHSANKLQHIKNTIIGGAPVSTELQDQLKELKITLFHTFGMTETISHVAMRKIGKDEDLTFNALPGIEFSEQFNQLVIHYPEIGLSNLQTNDLIRLKNKTSFEWLGRADFIINSGGIKMNPEEIENKLSKIIELPFFVMGISDKILGHKLVLILESETSIGIKKAEFTSILSKFMIPKEIIYLQRFVRTESGKINRIESSKLISRNVLKEIL